MTDMNEILEVAEQAIKEAREGNYKASEAIAKLEGIRDELAGKDSPEREAADDLLMDAVYPVLQAATDGDADALGAANADADSLLEQYRTEVASR